MIKKVLVSFNKSAAHFNSQYMPETKAMQMVAEVRDGDYSLAELKVIKELESKLNEKANLDYIDLVIFEKADVKLSAFNFKVIE